MNNDLILYLLGKCASEKHRMTHSFRSRVLQIAIDIMVTDENYIKWYKDLAIVLKAVQDDTTMTHSEVKTVIRFVISDVRNMRSNIDGV